MTPTPSCGMICVLLFCVGVVGALASEVAGCPCEDRFSERVEDLEKKIYEMYMDADKMTTKIADAIHSVDKLLATGIAGVSKVKARPIVSFSVQTSRNLPFLAGSEVIKFDEVLVNNGGAYDPHSGVFLAPTDGVYLFSASILSGFNATIETMITLNGHEVTRIYSGAYKNRGYGSGTAVLNLRKGDEVAVAVFYGNGNYVHKKWSMFSGTLLETY